MEITVSPEEKIEETLSEAHLAQAIEAIQTQGFVVLADVIAHTHLDMLHERMLADSQELLAAKRWGGAGQVQGHLQQGTPPFAPYVFSDIVANPYAIQVTKAILGAGVYNRFYNGNTNCPGSGTQPLHRDGLPLWPNLQTAHPPCSLIINVFLTDVTEANGATRYCGPEPIWKQQLPTALTPKPKQNAAPRCRPSGLLRAKAHYSSEIIGCGTGACLTTQTAFAI